MKKRNLYFIILAGGSGKRLWPLSTNQCPKQLLALANGKTLLEQTIQLIRNYTKTPSKVLVSTASNHKELVNQTVGTLIDRLVIEPSARNTGPAILYNCLKIYQDDPEAIIVCLPADSYIPQNDTARFINAIDSTVDFVRTNDAIALLGVKPTHPATGYGYIEYFSEITDTSTGLFHIKKFHEKPAMEVAREYIKSNTMLWNIGMFCGQVSTFLNEFKYHAPDLYQAVYDSIYRNLPFDELPAISIDYALIEQSENTWVLPVDFSWCDVGNVSTFLNLKQQEGKTAEKVLLYNAKNNVVDVPNKLVALIGVHDLCVVQTEDVLLIMRSNDAEDVSAIVDQLKEQEWYKYM